MSDAKCLISVNLSLRSMRVPSPDASVYFLKTVIAFAVKPKGVLAPIGQGGDLLPSESAQTLGEFERVISGEAEKRKLTVGTLRGLDRCHCEQCIAAGDRAVGVELPVKNDAGDFLAVPPYGSAEPRGRLWGHASRISLSSRFMSSG